MKWQDPPAPSKPQYDKITIELRANPGRWALLQEDKKNTSAATYARRKFGAEFEVVTRTNAKGLQDVYVRFIPERD